jgi:hypothetical protein
MENDIHEKHFNDYYQKILSFVKLGYTTEKACLKAGINSRIFYRLATEKQKQEVYLERKLHTKYGQGIKNRSKRGFGFAMGFEEDF